MGEANLRSFASPSNDVMSGPACVAASTGSCELSDARLQCCDGSCEANQATDATSQPHPARNHVQVLGEWQDVHAMTQGIRLTRVDKPKGLHLGKLKQMQAPWRAHALHVIG